MKLRKKSTNNSGFSLVEVIVSMAILAIIAVPLLSYFVTSAEYNARAKNRQKAVVLAQSIMEQCKDKSIEEIAKSFHMVSITPSVFSIVSPDKINNDASRVQEVDAAGNSVGTKGASGSYVGNTFTNSSNGMLYYSIKNIEEDGNRYDALITVDTNKTNATKYYAVNNDVTKMIADIYAIESPKNVVAVESSQNARAVVAMKDLNRQYCDNENDLHKNDPSWTYLIPYDDAWIHDHINRIMCIDVDPSGINNNLVKVKIYYKYICTGIPATPTTPAIPDIPGCPLEVTNAVEVDPPLYQEIVSLADLKNVYLFFQSEQATEQVVLKIDDNAAINFQRTMNLYLLCQATNLAVDDAPTYSINVQYVGNSYNKIGSVYSNADSVKKNGAIDLSAQDEYITKSSVLRMMNIKVDIYNANTNEVSATLSSTKREE